MARSRCSFNQELSRPSEAGQPKKGTPTSSSASTSSTSTTSTSSTSRQTTPKSEPTTSDQRANMPRDQEKEERSRANSVCIEMPDSPFGIPTDVAALLGAGSFVPPERTNIHPSPHPEAKPFNFGTVIPGVYRSSYPQDHDYRFIKDLGLKSIVTLVHKDMPSSYKPFMDHQGIIHHVFDMKGTKKESIPLDTMRNILSLILDPRQHPLLMHCNHGKHRTGCVVGVVRKLSGWQMSSILQEYRSYADPKVRETDLEYITNFEVDHLASMFQRPRSVALSYPNRLVDRAAFTMLGFTIMCLVFMLLLNPETYRQKLGT